MKESTQCILCGCEKSLHHGNQKQKNEDETVYIRTCFGIGCTCGLLYPEITKKTLKMGGNHS